MGRERNPFPPYRSERRTMDQHTVPAGRPYSRADVRTKLKIDDEVLQEAIVDGVFPKPDFSALYLASRWKRTTLRTWYASGGAARLQTWLDERP